MTYGAIIFLIIHAFQILTANPVSLEYPIIPKIDCNDLNKNGHPDFIAVNNSSSPRSLYHIEYNGSGVEFIWDYSMPENVQGYFTQMLLDDFDNDGGLELIVATSQNDGEGIFYVFPADVIGFNVDIPKIVGIDNFSASITHPWKLYSMNTDSDGSRPFIITQGSPSRHIIMCKYIDGKINSVGSFGNKFIDQSMGPLELSFGNFDGDGIEDLFILTNSPDPEGYFIFSDGSEEANSLDNYPRLRMLYKKGVDLNFDGIDDLLMINRTGDIMSNIWGAESIMLSDSNIQDINVSLDNGLIFLNTISQKGALSHYTIDPLTRSILTSEYNLPHFTDTEFIRAHSLITKNHLLLINDGTNPELWLSIENINRVAEMPLPGHKQKIYSEKADYVINVGDIFIHPIKKDTAKTFLHFTEEFLPKGMGFNLGNIQLEWTPTISQLGFHEFSYMLELREGIGLEMETENDLKLVSQKENIIEEKHTSLIYVNDPVIFNFEEKQITFINKESSELIIPIKDNNIDALLKVQQIKGDKTADFQLSSLNNNQGLLDSIIIKENNLTQPTNLDSQFYNVSSTNTGHHTSTFLWTPTTDQKNSQFSLTVFDGYSTDTLTFTVTIHPEIDLSMNQTTLNATVNQAINIPIELKQSPPSGHYKYELLNAPENMWVSDGGIINWIPMATDVDDNIFSIRVTDGIASSELQYKINVNAVPVISSRPSNPYIIYPGDSLSFPLENFDLNKNVKLKWKLISGPTNMTVNPEGVLKWVGTQLDYHPYVIQLSDGIDSISWSGSIYVNSLPVIISEPITLILENELYEYQLEAQDVNDMNPADSTADTIIEFELLNGPTGMVLDSLNVLHWNPVENLNGDFPISISATDGLGKTYQYFQLFINSSPVITSIDSISIQIGDTLNFYISAVDSNPKDSLFYIIEDMHLGMSLNNSSGLLTWIPSKSDLGQQRFNLVVKDGKGETGTNDELQIFVYMPPIFTGDLSTEGFVGLEYSAFLTAENMFSDKLKHPKAITIEATTIKDYTLSEPYGHYFQWTPGKMDIGSHEIHMRITDKYGFTTLHTHSISVYKNPCFQCAGSQDSSPADTTGN